MAPSKNWTTEQISYIMERSTTGSKPAQIEKEVKTKWPEKEVAKGAISNLISRQNKKKLKTQENAQASRETSTPPSIRSDAHDISKAQASSPSVPETPEVQQRTVSPEEFVTPFCSPKIRPFATFATPPSTDQSIPASSLLTRDKLPAPETKIIESASSIQKVEDVPEAPASCTSIPQPLSEVDEPISPAAEPKVELENREGSKPPNLPSLSPAIPTSSLPATILRPIHHVEDEDDHPFLPAPVIEIPESVINSARESFEFPFTGLVNEPVSHEDDTTPNSPILTSQTHKEQLPAIEKAPTNTFKRGSPAQSSSASELESLNLILGDYSSDTVQPEPEVLEPVEQRPAKRLKIEIETKEIDIETDSELTVDHMEVDSNVAQAPTYSATKESTNSVSKQESKTQQEQKPSEALKNMSSPQATVAQLKMSNFFETLGSEIVTIIVGPKRKEYPIHGNLLRQNSSVFKDFKFATNDRGQAEHSLRDADSDAIVFVFNWLYRQVLDFFPNKEDLGLLKQGPDAVRSFTKNINRAIQVYALALKLGMDELGDLSMTALGQAYSAAQLYPSSKDIAMAYNNTPSGSGLRKYMARSYQVLADLEDADIEAAGWTAEEVDEVVSDVPALFKDFRALNRKSKGVELTELSLDLICSYHGHGPDAECPSKGLTFRGLTS